MRKARLSRGKSAVGLGLALVVAASLFGLRDQAVAPVSTDHAGVCGAVGEGQAASRSCWA